MPEHQMGGVGPRQPGMGGEQRPALVAEGGPLGGPAGQVGGPGHLGRVDGIAEHPSQGGVGRLDPGAEHGRRRRRPHAPGMAARTSAGIEVVEGGDHRSAPTAPMAAEREAKYPASGARPRRV